MIKRTEHFFFNHQAANKDIEEKKMKTFSVPETNISNTQNAIEIIPEKQGCGDETE